MPRKIIGVIVCMLLITVIIPINKASETNLEYNTFQMDDAKILIRGKPENISIEGGLLVIISRIKINALIHLEFPMKLFSHIPIVVVNGERLTIEGPVALTMENFTGFGTPALVGPLRIRFWMLRFFVWGWIFIGEGDIIITPLE